MTMQDYHEYLQELDPDRGCVFNEKGFATYKISGKECYIDNIYTKPDFRKGKVASELADMVVVMAKEKGCCMLTGTVYTDKTTGNYETDLEIHDRSVRVLLGYGFRPLRFDENVAWFIKEI